MSPQELYRNVLDHIPIALVIFVLTQAVGGVVWAVHLSDRVDTRDNEILQELRHRSSALDDRIKLIDERNLEQDKTLARIDQDGGRKVQLIDDRQQNVLGTVKEFNRVIAELNGKTQLLEQRQSGMIEQLNRNGDRLDRILDAVRNHSESWPGPHSESWPDRRSHQPQPSQPMPP